MCIYIYIYIQILYNSNVHFYILFIVCVLHMCTWHKNTVNKQHARGTKLQWVLEHAAARDTMAVGTHQEVPYQIWAS